MAEKILYILGAGASANALPLAKTALDKETGDILIDGLASALNKVNLDKIFLPVEHNNANNYDDMKNRFKWLSGASKVFGDVDTFAKYLHINQPGGEQIQRLKKTLAEFFIIK